MMIQPSIIYVDKAVRDLPHTQRILSRVKNCLIEEIDDIKWLKTSTDFTDAKGTWLLTKQKGQMLKPCPAMQPDLKCCNYYITDFISNCPMDCSYCFLQSYLANNPILTIYTNVEEIIAQIGLKLSQKPNIQFRIGTGELSDSLALDPITGISEKLITFFGVQSNAVLELKTKTTHVDHLLHLNHNDNTVISWSVNPPLIVEAEEHRTATLDERLNAAKRAVAAGYKVGFHLDPIIRHDNWEENYQALIKQLFESVPGEKIAWISLGTLRYTDELKQISTQRFPASRIFYDEQVPLGNIYRYFRPIRQRMYATLRQFVRHESSSVHLYICMDTKEINQAVVAGEKRELGIGGGCGSSCSSKSCVA